VRVVDPRGADQLGWTATDLNRVRWDSPDGGAASFMTGQVLVIDGGQTATA
jgi:hypothetical protein